jgi:hypothetical protein
LEEAVNSDIQCPSFAVRHQKTGVSMSIRLIEQREGLLEFQATGTITGDDYDDVMIPAVERALETNDRVRVLYQLGPDFEGFELAAAWDDARLGLRHWSAFERMAIITDVQWVRASVRAIGFAMPCPIQVFALSEREDARRWIEESIGAIHLDLDEENDLLKVRLLGSLEPTAYRGVSDDIDAFASKRDRIKLLLDLRDFDGWQGIGGLSEHLSLVRDHHRLPERVALVGDAAWQRLASGVASRFLDAEVRFFPAPEYPDAEKWILAGE